MNEISYCTRTKGIPSRKGRRSCSKSLKKLFVGFVNSLQLPVAARECCHATFYSLRYTVCCPEWEAPVPSPIEGSNLRTRFVALSSKGSLQSVDNIDFLAKQLYTYSLQLFGEIIQYEATSCLEGF